MNFLVNPMLLESFLLKTPWARHGAHPQWAMALLPIRWIIHFHLASAVVSSVALAVGRGRSVD